MEPLVLEFDVAAAPDHAFDVWTSKAGVWWPPGHTISGQQSATIVFESFPGGRVYERAPDGAEHEWGEVIVWDPPQRVAYLWHLFFDRSDATHVEVTFTPSQPGTTVRISQTGWERLGSAAEERRTNTHRAWSVIAPLYREAAEG